MGRISAKGQGKGDTRWTLEGQRRFVQPEGRRMLLTMTNRPGRWSSLPGESGRSRETTPEGVNLPRISFQSETATERIGPHTAQPAGPGAMSSDGQQAGRQADTRRYRPP